jgi:uncharacterized protein (TIGR02217 family)
MEAQPMTFRDTLFPIDVSLGAMGGPGFSTDVVTINSGDEVTNRNWADARCEFDVSHAMSTDTKRAALIAFFRVMGGRADSFRYRDFTDWTVSITEGKLTALVAPFTYQLIKRYATDDGSNYDRTILLPFDVVVKQGATTLAAGVDYTLDDTGGTITVMGSPLPVPDAWSGSFDIPARFNADTIKFAAESRNVFRTESIQIIEKRNLL